MTDRIESDDNDAIKTAIIKRVTDLKLGWTGNTSFRHPEIKKNVSEVCHSLEVNMKNLFSDRGALFFSLFGLCIIIVGVAIPIPPQYVQVKDPGLALAILGFVISLMGLLLPGFWSFTKKIERSLLIEVTDSSSKNWKTAIDMCKDVRDGWTILDTSSGPNDRKFDKAVQDIITRYSSVEYYRIMFFPESNTGELIKGITNRTEKYFLSQIDESFDGAKEGGYSYDWLRKAITRGKFHLLHLPFPLAIDYFVVASSEEKRCLIGFAESPAIVDAGLSYSNGIVSRRSDLSKALENHFWSVLLPAAERHIREQIQGKTCTCSQYYHSEHPDTLWPNI